MSRLSNWRSRLHEYITEVRSVIYEPGIQDCALFPAGAVHAMTGIDYAAPYRGKYDTILGGIRLLKKDGYNDHEALAASQFEQIHPSEASMGDLVVFETEDELGIAVGVVITERAFVLSEAELGTVETLTAKRAYRV